MAKKNGDKKANKVAVHVLFLAIGFIVGFFLNKYLTQPPKDTLATQVVSVKEDGNLYTINAEYPLFKSGPKSFNAGVESFINQSIEEFKQSSSENWKARQETTPTGSPTPSAPDSPFSFMGTWEPAQLNDNFLSFVVRISAFSGGANAQNTLQTFNFDLKNKKEMTLADLFSGDKDYLNKLSTLARDQLSSSLSIASDGNFDKEMLDTGTEPTVENFENFIFDGTTITLIFPQYQVAPGVFGEQTVQIPQDKTSFDNLYQESLNSSN